MLKEECRCSIEASVEKVRDISSNHQARIVSTGEHLCDAVRLELAPW